MTNKLWSTRVLEIKEDAVMGEAIVSWYSVKTTSAPPHQYTKRGELRDIAIPANLIGRKVKYIIFECQEG
jgi:hypothetical protein